MSNRRSRGAHGAVAFCLTLLGAHAAAVHAAPPAGIPLPLNGTSFHTYDMAFSADGERVCVTGSDIDDMGASVPVLVLVDRERGSAAWRKPIALPDVVATAYPVKCLVGAERVVLLTNAATGFTQPGSSASVYVYAFDLRGNPIASTRLAVPGQNQYGYTLAETPDRLTVAGYTMDADDKNERYATFTLHLDQRLQPRGAPLQRRNGAFAWPFGARLEGDSLYIAGTFFPATAPAGAAGAIMASRMKANGGYVWSTPATHVADVDVRFVVAPDGTTHALSIGPDNLTLTTIGPDGKAHPPSFQPGTYCSVASIAPYGDGVAAVVKPCKGKHNRLVTLSLRPDKGTIVKTLPNEPLYVATKEALWSALARAPNGKVYLYTGTAGSL